MQSGFIPGYTHLHLWLNRVNTGGIISHLQLGGAPYCRGWIDGFHKLDKGNVEYLITEPIHFYLQHTFNGFQKWRCLHNKHNSQPQRKLDITSIHHLRHISKPLRVALVFFRWNHFGTQEVSFQHIISRTAASITAVFLLTHPFPNYLPFVPNHQKTTCQTISWFFSKQKILQMFPPHTPQKKR